MKKIIRITLIITMLFACSMIVSAQEKTEELNTVLDSFSGEIIENEIPFSVSGNKINFIYQDQSYIFTMKRIYIDTDDGTNIEGANFYTGNNGKIRCNMVEYNGKYCVQVMDTSQSVEERKNNKENNFTLVCGSLSEATIDKMSNTIKLENDKMEITKIKSNLSILATTGSTYNLYVYKNGLSVPFLISSGSAEGWAKSTKSSGSYYSVTNVKYSVTYNWPSDGVSLWYDYQNSRVACESPASPSAQTTTIPGTWSINGNTGAFQAEATVTALVNNSPLMWTLYDVCNMNGTPR